MTKPRANETDLLIGQKIKQTRKDAGLSQKKLGEEVGVSFQQIQKIENGKNRISASRLLDVAKVFDTTPNHFYPLEESES